MHRTQGEAPHGRCDDGTDASHFPCTRRSFEPIWAVLASVCDGRCSGELIRDGNDQLVMKDETKDMCRVTESIQKQHGKISKPTSHFTPPHNMVTIYHQDTVTGQDNDHPHLTDSHFPQDDQGCDNLSSSSHGTGSFALSNTISSIDLTTWGPDVRRHNQSGRSMGSTDTTAVVTTRRGLARASQGWPRWLARSNLRRAHTPPLHDRRERVNMPRWENCTKCQQRLSTEKRDYWKEAKVSTRESLGEGGEMARRTEEQKNRAFRSSPRRPRPRARFPTLQQMNDQLRNDQPNKNESGPGPTSRTPTVAASSSTNDHLEEVLKGQAEFLQHMWVQQSQMQRGNATSSNDVDIRRDAAKNLARVDRDRSAPEGRRLMRTVVGVVTSTR